jgi:hypothetical protein
VLVDVSSGEVRIPLDHPDEAALVCPPAWVDSSSFYASSNVGRDFAAIVRHDLATATTTPIAGTGERFDAEVVASRNRATIIVIENRDGTSEMRRYDPDSGTRGAVIPLPEAGVTHFFSFPAPLLSDDGSRTGDEL